MRISSLIFARSAVIDFDTLVPRFNGGLLASDAAKQAWGNNAMQLATRHLAERQFALCERLLAAAPSDEHTLILMLGGFAGLRLGEIAAARRRDVIPDDVDDLLAAGSGRLRRARLSGARCVGSVRVRRGSRRRSLY